MAKGSRTTKRRKSKGGWLRRLFQLAALIALCALIYSAWFWYEMRSWRPDEALYPEQGAVIAAGASNVRFETLKATGASFVYLELAQEGGAPDPGFRERLRAAKASGLKVGIMQAFDPCQRADPQSSRYTRMAARDPKLLPPVVQLARLPDSCETRVTDAAVTSEVTTLINQIEGHAGKPVILRLSAAFERRFRLAGSVDRDIWLESDRFRPDYAPRPWLLWSANSQLVSEASKEPIEWVVVQK